jgi:hypothetical protein
MCQVHNTDWIWFVLLRLGMEREVRNGMTNFAVSSRVHSRVSIIMSDTDHGFPGTQPQHRHPHQHP